MMTISAPAKNNIHLFPEARKSTKPLVLAIMILCLFLAAFSPTPALSAASREKYAAGRKYMQGAEWQKALEILKPLINDYPLLTDYLLRDIAICYEKSGDLQEAAVTLRKIISDYKGSPLYMKAYEKILEIGNTDDIASNLADYDLYLQKFPRDGRILWGKSCLLSKSGHNDAALALQREILLNGSPYAVKSYEALKAADCRPSYDEIKIALARLMEKGNYKQTLSLLEDVDLEDEEGKYLAARAYFRLRLYNKVIKSLQGVTSPDGKYLLAMSVLRTKGRESFYKLLEEFIGQNPRDIFQLYLTAVDMKQRDGSFPEAYNMLEAMKSLYPAQREKIVWTEAWLAIRQKRFPEADKILTKLIAGQTIPNDKYMFWLGKVKIYQGLKGDAYFTRINDKTSYYWFKAGMGVPFALAEKKDELPKTEQPLIIPETNLHLWRIAELESLQMRNEARAEARSLFDTIKHQDVSVLAGLLVAMEDYPGLIKLGRKRNNLRLAYPFAFRETVIKCAQEQNSDPFLIMAIMREESHFRNDAVSVAGALGLMQLMPATARKVGNISHDRELFEVQKNIRIGTTHLSSLLSQFGELPYAIAAYNAGGGNVKKWLTANYQDEDEFMEDIPYGETKDYVLRVMSAYFIMKLLYGSEGEVEASHGTPPG